MVSHIETERTHRLPEDLRNELRAARIAKGLSQLELGRRVGLPQAHISGIESGKVVPRYDTLLDVIRSLDRDLVVVPRTLSRAVKAFIREDSNSEETRPLYAITGEDDDDSEI